MTEMLYDDLPAKSLGQGWDDYWQANGRRYFLAGVLLAEALVGILIARIASG